MRLQMHVTDCEFLYRRLGTIQSEGCIRIPSTVDSFIDRHAIESRAEVDFVKTSFWKESFGLSLQAW